jgi:hypothetical protein
MIFSSCSRAARYSERCVLASWILTTNMVQ